MFGGVSVIFCSPITWLVAALTIFYYYYRKGTATFNYFTDQGIPGPKPLPFVGNLWGVWKKNLPKCDRELMKKYGKTFGCFDGLLPNLWTTDVDLIRSIFVKDFDHFINRRDFEVTSKVFRKIFVRDQAWKDVRAAVTPAFTTGKIKRMSVLIEDCTNRLVKKLEGIAENEGKIDGKRQFDNFTMDVIARCAFGMNIQNLGSEDDPFMKNAKVIFNPPGTDTPFVLFPVLFPSLMKAVGEKMFGSAHFKFFIDTLEGLIRDRSESSERYNDFVEIAKEIISDYKKEENGQLVPMWESEEVDEIVIAQSTSFLLAGFDTTATTLTNSAYLLAMNPDVQEKLHDQVATKLEQFGHVNNHEMILDFPYLEQVIREVLRMCPTATRLERQCNKDVTYNGIYIKAGTVVTVPSFALHYDEDYYQDPEKFDPDRWSPENKASINQYAWMPFGMGPRNCVGMRFALEEVKIALCTLVNRFQFLPAPETPTNLIFKSGVLQFTQPLHGTVGIKLRT